MPRESDSLLGGHDTAVISEPACYRISAPPAITPAPPAGLKDEYVRRKQEKGKGKNNFGSYDPDDKNDRFASLAKSMCVLHCITHHIQSLD